MDWLHENEDRLPSDFMALPLDFDLVIGILTRERIRLLDHLRTNGPAESLQELADALDRDKTAVSRDVSFLNPALVQVESHGRQKRIWASDKPIIIY